MTEIMNEIVNEYEEKQETLAILDIIDIYLGKYENYNDYINKVKQYNLEQKDKVFLKNANCIYIIKKEVNENIFSTAYYKGLLDRETEKC